MAHNIYIADDHSAVRRLLASLLARQPDFVVAGSAIDGLDAVSEVLRLRPDVVVMDISMPRMNGIDATRELCAHWPEAKVIILSMHATADYVRHAMEAGARGYVIKDSAAQEIIDAVRAVIAGRRYLSQRIAELAPDSPLPGDPRRIG